MPNQLRIDNVVAQRTVETDVVRNVGIPSDMPPAERVVSVNGQVEVTETDVETGFVVYSGIIRSTIFYASAENPANVESLSRNFSFTDRVAVNGARPGLDVTIDAVISDIDFNVINNRLLGIEFTITSDIELTSPGVVQFAEERPGVTLRREEYRIQRQVRERNYSRTITDEERLPSEAPDLQRVINLESSSQISNITIDYDQVSVRGVINSNLLYNSIQRSVEYTNLRTPFYETFSFGGITPDMNAYVDITVASAKAEKVDARRVNKTFTLNFRVLVIKEETVAVPIEIVGGQYYPVRRTVLIKRIVAEERTRILENGRITIPAGNPDIGRVVRANGRIVGGSVQAETESGGVLINGVDDINVIYVADLPDQPVYFTSGRVTFSNFVDIPGVTAGMDVVADVSVERVSASKINERTISVRVVHEVNLVVTEEVRVPIITGISEQPTQPGQPTGAPAGQEGFITYTVKSGDTLYLIAQRYGVSVQRPIAVNNISRPEQLEVGQQLLIPR